MKKLSATLVLFFFISVCVAGVKSELAMGYKILKDTVDATVESGKCKISGIATYDGVPIANAVVYGEKTRSVRTNAKGEFEVTVESTEQYLIVTMDSEREGYLEGYKFTGGHSIDCEIYVRDLSMMINVDKPVIYLYSDNDISVNVGLETKMNLVFTYPQLSENNDWKMHVGASGIEDMKGKYYPYLFWEGQTDELTYSTDDNAIIGELVKTDSIVPYLEKTLSTYGLNETETTDFITYWAPRMIQYEYVVTQFDLDELVSSMASLDVSPIPDHQRRLYMLFTGFDTEPDIQLTTPSFEVIPFERNGFTLLEWGGSEVSRIRLFRAL
ncbi:MAG: hypothetical protein H6599_10210 [Flavobacteriales bacterium]|nr:hypothetical protein [Flavobacteriales bacterium]